jgi:hypothetical protein
VTDVNEVYFIQLTVEMCKQSRAMTGTRFRIARNAQLAMLDLDYGPELCHGKVYGLLLDWGMSD